MPNKTASASLPRWIIPYPPYLSLRYAAHINVEICSSIDAIKYIANNNMDRLPSNDKQHREFGANFQLSASDLHKLGTISSVSKIHDEEFWLLRALWPKPLDTSEFHAGNYGYLQMNTSRRAKS